MTPERTARVAQIAAGCPPLYRRNYERVCGGRPSPRTAIKVMCLHCCGWERAESSKCTAYGCPLWAYNPWRQAVEVPSPTKSRRSSVLEAKTPPPEQSSGAVATG